MTTQSTWRSVSPVQTLLPNYISVNQILIDHAQKFIKETRESAPTQGERARRQWHAKETSTRFLKDPGNYSTHHAVQPFMMVDTQDERGVRFAAGSPSADLLDSHDWSAGAKPMFRATDKVTLAAAVTQFRARLDDHFERRSTLDGGGA